MATSRSLSIGELATQVGLNASAIRYYEAANLLPAAERLAGKRRYNRETVDLLLLIRFCQRLGFTLDEVRELLEGPQPALSRTRGKEKWRAMVDAKLDEVASLIRSARAVQRVLRESRDCDCVTPSSCRFVRREAGRPAFRALAKG
jgi:MerR family redox-sensitive transcriptional activator SoxR